MAAVIEKVKVLESLGASIHALALDIGSPSAATELSAALDSLSLPPVLGVIHAAGVSGYGYIKDTTPESYAHVMGPKIQGTLNLHSVFPPGTLQLHDSWSVLTGLLPLLLAAPLPLPPLPPKPPGSMVNPPAVPSPSVPPPD